MIEYNPLNKKCKNITGGIRQNETFIIRVFGDSREPCFFVLYRDGGEARYFPMQIIANGWQIEFSIEEPGLYFYFFETENRKIGVGRFLNATCESPFRPYQLTVYSADFKTPDWFKGGIMYQIFPDRFYKSGEICVPAGKYLHENWTEAPFFRANENGKILNNDFFGGNLNGIREKLPYLQQLNISVIYLNPIFEAYSNHRYDTGDFLKIDPLLGDCEDFEKLIEEARQCGIKIVLDGVFNHTGADSRYFNRFGHYDEVGAYQSKNSDYYSWYKFTDYPDRYDCWWGIDILPAVNELSSFDEFITGEQGVLRTWMRFGLGGFRLDVADELPSCFLQHVRSAIKAENQEAILIGEVWEDASDKVSYGERRTYLQGRELDSVMNYPLKDAIIDFILHNDTSFFRSTVMTLLDHYPKQVTDCLMNILGTHDTVRILTAMSGIPAYDKEQMNQIRLTSEQYRNALDNLKAAVVLQFT